MNTDDRSETVTPLNVLVVEDSADQAALLRTYIERAGCAVTVVASAEEALLAYRATVPDLAVIDLQLPGMSGGDLAKRLRADHPECAIAITSVLDVAHFPASHVHLPKPFTRQHVCEMLRDALPNWRVA